MIMTCPNIEIMLADNLDLVFNMETNQVNCVALNNVIRGLEYVKAYGCSSTNQDAELLIVLPKVQTKVCPAIKNHR